MNFILNLNAFSWKTMQVQELKFKVDVTTRRPSLLSLVRVPIQYRMRLSSVRWGSRADLKNIGDGDGVVIVANRS
jgi:hypothetical protein